VIRPFGEAALLVELGESRRVQALAGSLLHAPLPGVVEVVPGVETLLVELEPADATETAGVERAIEQRLAALGSDPSPAGRERTIPCCYGGECGPDLEEVARFVNLAPDEVIRRHAAASYGVALLGFAPGFAYLDGLPAELEVPRLETPRTATPAGSVAIAGRQSGIYPADLPGGWRIIGRTSLTLFDPRRDPPAYLAPGDRVRFVPVAAHDLGRHRGSAADW
jgi:KipI family sensor histidine kinase inhibitor